MSLMKGKKGLIMGVANERSIAWGISQKLSEAGAELAFTYLGDALKKRVVPLAEKLNSKFSDKDGQLKNLWMGCYGIGVTRIAQAAIEQNHDQKGICWPIQISPFEVIIIPTNLKDPIQSDLTEQIYNNFLINKIDVLLDDRNDRAGVKFKDADLIGIPFQIIIGRDSINKEVELLCRKNNTKLKISTDKLLETFISESEIMYNKKS